MATACSSARMWHGLSIMMAGMAFVAVADAIVPLFAYLFTDWILRPQCGLAYGWLPQLPYHKFS
jgi:hypothetical protein